MKVKVFTILTLAAVLFLAACGKSDADLQKAATDKLTADKVSGATVAVKDGVATLTGQVADITVKTKAENSVKSVEGIKSVNNNLALTPPPPAAAPAGDDKMLEGTINESLKKSGVTGVTVSVSNGTVTLSGEVATKEDMAKAMQAASATHPEGIQNKVTVKK